MVRYQSGLAKKVEKPSRKLRKERKNRAKKVRFSLLLFTSGCSFVKFSSVAPRRPRLPNHRRRANKADVGLWPVFIILVTKYEGYRKTDQYCVYVRFLPLSLNDHRGSCLPVRYIRDIGTYQGIVSSQNVIVRAAIR